MILNETVVSFVTVILESVLFGVSLLLLAVAVRELFRPSSVHWRMLVLTGMFFTLSTIGYIAILYRNITFTLLVTRGVVKNTADSYRAYSFSTLLGFLAYMASTLLANAVVIYRSSRLWRKRAVLILPCVLWMGLLASTVGSLIVRLRTDHSERMWTTASVCLSLVTNLLSTGLLAYKVYSVDRTYRLDPSTIIRVVVESGIIYSVWLIVSLVVTLINTAVTRIFLSTLNSVIPITFYLLIIQACRKESGIGMGMGMVFRTTAGSDFTDFTFPTSPNRGYTSPPLSPLHGRSRMGSLRVIDHGHELVGRRRAFSDASTVTLSSLSSPQSPYMKKFSQDFVITSTAALKEVPEAVVKV